jgi:hypothetical protein
VVISISNNVLCSSIRTLTKNLIDQMCLLSCSLASGSLERTIWLWIDTLAMDPWSHMSSWDNRDCRVGGCLGSRGGQDRRAGGEYDYGRDDRFGCT